MMKTLTICMLLFRQISSSSQKRKGAPSSSDEVERLKTYFEDVIREEEEIGDRINSMALERLEKTLLHEDEYDIDTILAEFDPAVYETSSDAIDDPTFALLTEILEKESEAPDSTRCEVLSTDDSTKSEAPLAESTQNEAPDNTKAPNECLAPDLETLFTGVDLGVPNPDTSSASGAAIFNGVPQRAYVIRTNINILVINSQGAAPVVHVSTTEDSPTMDTENDETHDETYEETHDETHDETREETHDETHDETREETLMDTTASPPDASPVDDGPDVLERDLFTLVNLGSDGTVTLEEVPAKSSAKEGVCAQIQAELENSISTTTLSPFEHALMWTRKLSQTPRWDLPACCDVTKLVKTTCISDGVVFLIMLYEVTVFDLKKRNASYKEVHDTISRFSPLLGVRFPNKAKRSLGYLLAGCLGKGWTQEEVAAVQAMLVEGGLPDVPEKKKRRGPPGRSRRVAAIITKGANLEEAKRFFTNRTLESGHPRYIYLHVVTLFSSTPMRTAILEQFKRGCNGDATLLNYFTNLYDLFFTQSLTQEIENLVDCICTLKEQELKNPKHFLGANHFSTKAMPTADLHLYNAISAVCHEMVKNTASGATHTGMKLSGYVSNLPSMEELMVSREVVCNMDQAKKCAFIIKNEVKGDDTATILAYKVLNASYEFPKVRLCVLIVLSLLASPVNYERAIEVLEDTLKQMALYNINPVLAAEFVAQLN